MIAILNRDLTSSTRDRLEKSRPNPLIGFKLLSFGSSFSVLKISPTW